LEGENMQKQAKYEEAIKTKYPEAIVLAIAKDADGKANPVTIGWSCIVSGSPAMFAIALAPKRHSVKAIRHSRCFTLVFPSPEMAEETLFFGTHSGRDVDKLKETGSKVSDAAEIDSVILEDAAANFECVLENELVAGDHILFIGKVVASHMNTEKKKRLYTIEGGTLIGGVSAVEEGSVERKK
jgi:flavin reductase (DIM6/NTAB) family NADH-FMN oxidoreductase RutF